MNISENIRKYRKSKMTQKELAEKSGVTASTITKYENGQLEPNIETLNKIAKALNVPINDLLQGECLTVASKKSLADYSTKDLLDEIARRCDR